MEVVQNLTKISRITILNVILATLVLAALACGLLGVAAYMREPYTTKQVTLYKYTKTSEYRVYATVKPNSIYGKSEVVEATGNIPLYLNLVKAFNITYAHSVSGAEPRGSFKVTVSLRHLDGWTVKFLEYSGEFANRISENVSLDIPDILEYMDNLSREIGQKLSYFEVVLDAVVNTKIAVGSTERDDKTQHSIVLRVDLVKNRVEVSGNKSLITPVEEKKTVYEEQNILGLSVPFARSAFTLASSTSVAGILVVGFMRIRLVKRDPLMDFESKYGGMVVEAMNGPAESITLRVARPQELVKLARILETPILKVVEEGRVRYMVVDRDKVYVFERE